MKMVDADSQDLPSRVTDVLRIFLAASARGEKAELVLETRNGMLPTKPLPAPTPRRRK